jgi:hypothetical protein
MNQISLLNFIFQEYELDMSAAAKFTTMVYNGPEDFFIGGEIFSAFNSDMIKIDLENLLDYRKMNIILGSDEYEISESAEAEDNSTV